MAKIIPCIILLVFFAVLGATVIYLSKKFTWIFGLESARFFYILLSIVPVYFLTAGIVFINSTSQSGHILYQVAAIAMGVYLSLVLSLIVLDLTNLLLNLKPGIFGLVLLGLTLLIPNGVQYAQKEGVDLYLAGHTHAGQIFPFSIIASWIFNYNRGLHEYKDTKIFVSEGVGTFGPPFRIGTKSEIIEIQLMPGNADKL